MSQTTFTSKRTISGPSSPNHGYGRWAGYNEYGEGKTVVGELLAADSPESLNPAFSHIWVMGFEAVAVSIAMYCIIQFYIQLKEDIKQHKPLLKVAAIKLVIFLSFWQTIVISFLTSSGAVTASKKFQTPDIKIGIPAMLLCIEMALFAVFHLWAFPWQPYRITSKLNMAESVPGYSASSADYKGGFLGSRALLHAFNPWDFVKAVGRSARWLFVGRRHRLADPSYSTARTDTGSTLGLEPTGKIGQTSSNTTNNMNADTSYKDRLRHPGQPPYAASDMSGEGEELLTHAQSNPTSGAPPHAYGPAQNEGVHPGDIGVARSDYGDDDDEDFKRYESNQPPMPAPYRNPANRVNPEPPRITISDDRFGGQQTGVVPYPGGHQTVNMPYFPPPPGSDQRSGRR
ncbi:MAG: hypothetical protein Q9227_004404 [Pyrenula ochraceoflavens]